LNTWVSFDADLLAEFFSGLERSDTPKGSTFRKSGRLVSEFPDSVIMDITVRVSEGSAGAGWLAPPAAAMLPFPPELVGLRFRVKWTGSSTQDLGEAQPELQTTPWRELGQPDRFYRIEVPSKGALLTDSLEVRILTKTGNQIGCIKGHI
jgi:hypothetical protein